MINTDITEYFSTKINTLSEDIENKKISSEDVLIQLNEINHYNIINSDVLHKISDSIDIIQDSIKKFNQIVKRPNISANIHYWWFTWYYWFINPHPILSMFWRLYTNGYRGVNWTSRGKVTPVKN